MRQDIRCSEGEGLCLVEQQVFNAKSQCVLYRVKTVFDYGDKSLSLCFYAKSNPKQNSQSNEYHLHLKFTTAYIKRSSTGITDTTEKKSQR